MNNYTFKVFPTQTQSGLENKEAADEAVAAPPEMSCPPTLPCPPLEPGQMQPMCPMMPCPPMAPGATPYGPTEPWAMAPCPPLEGPMMPCPPMEPCPMVPPCPPMGPGATPYGQMPPGMPYQPYAPGNFEMGYPQYPAMAAPPFTCPYFRLAHAYVPWQYFNVIYSPAEGHAKGTIFPELFMPQGQYGPCEGPRPCRLAFGGGVPCGY